MSVHFLSCAAFSAIDLCLPTDFRMIWFLVAWKFVSGVLDMIIFACQWIGPRLFPLLSCLCVGLWLCCINCPGSKVMHSSCHLPLLARVIFPKSVENTENVEKMPKSWCSEIECTRKFLNFSVFCGIVPFVIILCCCPLIAPDRQFEGLFSCGVLSSAFICRRMNLSFKDAAFAQDINFAISECFSEPFPPTPYVMCHPKSFLLCCSCKSTMARAINDESSTGSAHFSQPLFVLTIRSYSFMGKLMSSRLSRLFSITYFM
jgi:hypothetical protein